MPLTATPLLTGAWPLNRGLVNTRADSDLEPGELAVAHGVYYKRGSEDLHMKAGRTAFSAEQLGAPAGGLFYAEFSNPLATNRLLVRASTSLYSAPVGLTGTFGTAVLTGLSSAPAGFWGAYANTRYYLQDGASGMQVAEFKDDLVAAGEFIYRAAGMLPIAFKPTVTPVAAGSGTVSLTSATTSLGGDKDFHNSNLWVDADKNTFSEVFLGGDAGQTGKVTASAFTGTGSGVRTDWIISVTYGATVNNSASGNVLVEYDIGGGFVTAETTIVPQGKHDVTVPLIGTSQDSALIRVRITATKTTNRGSIRVQAYDVRINSTDGAASATNTLVTGVRYWVTEYADRHGIESSASPTLASDSTGAVTTIAGFQVSLPQERQNSITTAFKVYRTADGGAYPTGTLAQTVRVVDNAGVFTPKPSAFDPGPLNANAGTLTYGFFTVAGLFYERDIPPPIGTVITAYQNALVTAPVAFPNTIRYSASGFPESWPTLNSIALASERDDTVMGLAALSSQLGIFMRGRGKRLDHLPTPSDPTFAAAPEDFAPDHGLESRNGIAYITPPGGAPTHIAYVAKDGIRVTNLYQSTIITNNIDWRGTVDVSQLSSTILRSLPSESRLEFTFVPTAAFLTAQGWGVGTRAVMWLHYQQSEGFQLQKTRATVQPINITAAATVPVSGQDYTFLLSRGIGIPPSVVYVDEVGTSDAMNSVDTVGTIPRLIKTGLIYPDSDASKLARWRVLRATLEREAGTDTIQFGCRGIRVDRGQEWTRTLDYTNTFGGAKPVTFNVSGQATQFIITVNSTSGSPPAISEIGWTAEGQGEFL
jgi:hypothetical protein